MNWGTAGIISSRSPPPVSYTHLPRDIGKERPCLNFHMGKCDGYCRGDELKAQHDQAVSQAVSLLEGRFKEVQADLTTEMERAAEELRFEQAAQLRDRLRAIELLGKRQKVVAGSLADTDVAGFFRGEAKSCFVVLHYMEGELAAKEMCIRDSYISMLRKTSTEAKGAPVNYKLFETVRLGSYDGRPFPARRRGAGGVGPADQP